MATLAPIEWFRTLVLFALSFGQVIYAIPAEVEKRAICYEDNCLRELVHSSALASPFCNSYLGAATIT
jgi:hypothetical protein